MFDKKYKNAMDKVSVNEEALNTAINNAIAKPKSMNPLKIALIACLSVALICTSVFAAFKLSESENHPTVPNIQDGDSSITDVDITSSLLQQGFKYAESYEEVYKAVKDAQKYAVSEEEAVDGMETLVPEYTVRPFLPNETPSTPEYSNTNNQVLGVQEGDVVKTDGKYIYHLRIKDYKISIISAKDGKMETIYEINVDNKFSPQEILLIEDQLAVICTSIEKTTRNTTCIYYDISDRNNPKKVDEITQSGHFNNCRVVDGIVYIITGMYIYEVDNIKESSFTENKVNEFVPSINCIPIKPTDVIISDCYTNSYTSFTDSYTILSAYDVQRKTLSSDLAILGNVKNIYCSNKNIYITSNVRNGILAEESEESLDNAIPSNNTKIIKIALNDGEIRATAAGCVDGSEKNQFSMDEKDGIFRIATTSLYWYRGKNKNGIPKVKSKKVNNVYCLNNELEIIGKSEDLGISEEIKSVRFMGDIVYVVTFRQTDPLYAIDLSDPKSPKTLSELKIDGFSEYMQNYGNDYMLGIGYEADPETGITNGLKLTMFDITDPKDVFDVDTLSYMWEKDEYVDSNSIYNHKALLIDAEKGLIGLPIMKRHIGKMNWEYAYWTIEYELFSFNGENITEAGSFSCPLYETNVNAFTDKTRALYIGEYLYIVADAAIQSVSLIDHTVTNQIRYTDRLKY
ncbi:MAG: hypothetical protein E7586_00050 [Ruminococcaceae bacterium]|nr:hypothetical protein [Oscillospiraceae bacterium]